VAQPLNRGGSAGGDDGVTAPAVVRRTREGYRRWTAGPSGARPAVVRRRTQQASWAGLKKAHGLGRRAPSGGGAGVNAEVTGVQARRGRARHCGTGGALPELF
jgi:hypothetical protein